MFVFHAKNGAVPPRPNLDNYNFFIEGNSPVLKSIDSAGKIVEVGSLIGGGSGSGSTLSSGTYTPSAGTITLTSTDASTVTVTGITTDSRTAYTDYAIMSDFDWKADRLDFRSKFIIWSSIDQEIVFTWTPPDALVGTFFRRIAVVLWRNTGAGYNLFFTHEDASENARLTKMYNVRINFATQSLEWDALDFVDLPNSYRYQHYDSEHIYYLNANPANITRVNITGKPELKVTDLINNPFVSSQDNTWIKGDENCLYMTRFGSAGEGFKTQFYMARKQDPQMESILFKLGDEPVGFATDFEIDYINREIFVLVMNSSANFGQGNTSLIVVKYDFDTGEQLGRLETPVIINNDTGSPFLFRPDSILMHNRKLYIFLSRNPMLYVVDPYDMSVISGQYLSAYTESITDPDVQLFGGVQETGYIRNLPYKIRNNELVISILHNECNLIAFDLEGYSAKTSTTISDPINYVTYLTNDPVYPPRQKYVSNSISLTDDTYLYTSSLQEGRWRVTRSELTATTNVEYANVFLNTGQTTQPVLYADLSGLTYKVFDS